MKSEAIQMIIMAAILCEALVEYVKTIVTMFEEREYKTAVTQLITILLGIGLAFAFNLQLFNNAIGEFYDSLYINGNLDIIITGILFSRGSNYFSDIVSKLTRANITAHSVLEDEVEPANEELNDELDEEEFDGEFIEELPEDKEEVQG